MPIEAAHANFPYASIEPQHNGGRPEENHPLEPFGQAALRAASHGFAVIPCGGPHDRSGKQPLVRWGRFERRPGSQTIRVWAAQPEFRAANLGIIPGLSGITVVDCDTPGCLLKLFDLFGETPLVVATPSGGSHLYFRSSGERCARFRIGYVEGGTRRDIKGDIKGHGGFVVAPPSARIEDGKVRAYRFVEGDWPLREILPPIKDGAPGIARKFGRTVVQLPKANAGSECSVESEDRPTTSGAAVATLLWSRRVGQGDRNKALFAELRRIARNVPDEAALYDRAIQINETFDPPLGLAEVQATVGSVWRYRIEGRLIQRGDQAVVIPAATFDKLNSHPKGGHALQLLGLLQLNFRAKPGKSFAISAKAMADEKRIKGWTVRRYREAIATLMETGDIRRVHEGGNGPRDPHRYVLTASEPSLDHRAA